MTIRLRSLYVAALSLALSTVAAAQPSTVIVVRHAEKAATPGSDPALSDAGIQRAADLAAALAGARVATVITTQFQRTQLTAKPISDALGKAPTIVAAANPMAAHVEAVAAAVRARPAGEVVLVVGHSNTVPAIVAALGGPKMPDLCDPQYSMLYVLQFPASGAPTLIKANYGAADPKDAAACANPK
jgi:broad specificity phosphatase PhoE